MIKNRSDGAMPPLPPEEVPMVEVKNWRYRSESYPAFVPK